MSPDTAAQFYAQAWLATHFLVNTPERAEGFDRYIAALGEGGDPLGAFEPAFGVTREKFDVELRTYKRKAMVYTRYGDILADPDVPMKVERLGRAADDLVMPCAHLRSGPSAENAAPSVATIRAQAAVFPDDPYAIRALALAEIWYGALPKARTLLDGLLTRDAENAETHHLSGLCDLRSWYLAPEEALVKCAKSSFAKADKLDGARAGSLFRYVECGLLLGENLNAHQLDVLTLAFELAPQVHSIALMLAQGLMQHARFDEAVMVLRPLTTDLHGGGYAKTAQRLLAEARQKKFETRIMFGSAKSLEDDS